MSKISFDKKTLSAIREAFSSLSLYKTIEEEYSRKFNEKSLKATLYKLYVDPISPDNNTLLKELLQSNIFQKHHLLIGKKGSGKTTIVERMIIETDLSLIGNSQLLKGKKILGIFFALSKDYVESTGDNISFDSESSIRHYCVNLLEKLIERILDKLNRLNIDISIFKEKEIENIRKDLNDRIKKGEENANLKIIKKCIKTISKIKKIKVSVDGFEIEKELNKSFKFFEISELWRKLTSFLKNTFQIDNLYLFLDEYSEIEYDILSQKVIYDNLLGPIIGDISEKMTYVTLCAYPDKFYIGKQDLGKHFKLFDLAFHKSSGSYKEREKLAKIIIERLLVKRFDYYLDKYDVDLRSKELLNKLFYTSYIDDLFYGSLMVPRDIGAILSFCIGDLESKGKINITTLKEGIKNNYEYTRFNYFSGVLKQLKYEKEDILSDKELFKEIVRLARKNHLESNENRFAFFSIFEENMKYLNRLEAERLLYLVDGPKKYKGSVGDIRANTSNVFTYFITYGECLKNNIPVSSERSDLWTGTKINYHKELSDFIEDFAHYCCENDETHIFPVSVEESIMMYGYKCPKCSGSLKKVLKFKAKDDKTYSFKEKIDEMIDSIKNPFTDSVALNILQILYEQNQIDYKIALKPKEIGQRLDLSYQKIAAVIRTEDLVENKYVKIKFESGTKKYKINHKGKETFKLIFNSILE